MNQRIKDLAERAKIYFREVEFSGEVLSDGEVDFQDLEKFAELIVQECLSQVDKVDAMLDDDKEKTGVAWVGLAIAKHFGIE